MNTWHRWRRLAATILIATLVIAGLAAPVVAAPAAAPVRASTAAAQPGAVKPAVQAAEGVRVLVFSKTAGFRHDSIPDGVNAITQLGTEHGFSVDHTEDPTAFTDANLAQYQAVIWLSTTGDVLNPDQQAAFERYVQAGGGYVGIHAAADTEYDWPWYGGLVGAYFKAHPHIQQATINVLDRHHPSTAHLPDRWTRTDEWYDYQANPRGQVHVLAVLNERTYQGGSMGEDHPIAWCQEYDGGRAWYTGGGHTKESYAEAPFRTHLLGGILWAAGQTPGDCGGALDRGARGRAAAG